MWFNSRIKHRTPEVVKKERQVSKIVDIKYSGLQNIQLLLDIDYESGMTHEDWKKKRYESAEVINIVDNTIVCMDDDYKMLLVDVESMKMYK